MAAIHLGLDALNGKTAVKHKEQYYEFSSFKILTFYHCPVICISDGKCYNTVYISWFWDGTNVPITYDMIFINIRGYHHSMLQENVRQNFQCRNPERLQTTVFFYLHHHVYQILGHNKQLGMAKLDISWKADFTP